MKLDWLEELLLLFWISLLYGSIMERLCHAQYLELGSYTQTLRQKQLKKNKGLEIEKKSVLSWHGFQSQHVGFCMTTHARSSNSLQQGVSQSS